MNDSPSFPAPIEDASAVWLARRDRGLTAAEQDEFLQWLAEDPRHRACFAFQEKSWTDLDALSLWRPEHSSRPNPDLLVQTEPERPRLWLQVAACLVVALGVGLVLWDTPDLVQAAAAPTQLAAQREYDQQVLEDGSVIDLNRGSAVEVRYTAAERRVWLTNGEAHFTVAHNPARPFIVRAGKVDVRAVGTAFNVRLDPGAVEVLVTEGRVQLTPPPGVAEPPILHAGQRALLAADQPAAIDTVAADEMARLLAWQPRQLEFDSARLADVVAAFNRHNRLQLAIGDPTLADLPIGASFRSNNVEGFVRLLEASFGVKAERADENRIVLQRAP
jgi:transmembrane sensor